MNKKNVDTNKFLRYKYQTPINLVCRSTEDYYFGISLH